MPSRNSLSVGYDKPIIRRNIEAYANALNKLDTRHQQALERRNAIDVALSQLDLNEAEDEYKYNLRNQIMQSIEDKVAYGDYSQALTEATLQAGNLVSNPGLVGRIRAQADYKKFVEQTQARTDIDQRTKNWAIENNPYRYEDTFDSAGNVVGGTKWHPNRTPVSTVDLSKLGTLALQWAKPDGAKGSKAMFVDSNGNLTEQFSDDVVDVAYQTTTGYRSLGKDKLQQAINAAIDMTPGARASIEQDYDVAVWSYDKLTPEEKAMAGATEVTDSNGRFLNREEFLAKKINPWIDAAAYSDKESSVNYGTGLQTAFSLRQQAAANQVASQLQLGEGNVNYTGTGFNITYNTSDYIATAQGKIEDAIKSIEGAMPKIRDTKLWQEAKAKGDYLGMENIIKNRINLKSGGRYFNAVSQEARNIVDTALKNIVDNQSFVADRFKNLDKSTKDAILAKSAFDAGQKAPADNQYVKGFYNILNKISDNKPADSYRITFNDKSDVDQFLNNMGMNETTAKQNGMIFGYDKDFVTLTIKQNNNFLPKAVISFFDGNDDLLSLPWNRSRITALDSNGNEIGSQKRGTVLTSMSEGLMSRLVPGRDVALAMTGGNNGVLFNNFNRNLNSKVDKFNELPTGVRDTDQLKVADVPAIANAKRRYSIDSAEYARAKKEINDDLALRLSGSDWTQFGVYGYDENTRGLTIMPNTDRGEQMANIIGHIQNGKADIQFATNGIQHGYYITLHEKLDKNGNVDADATPKVYFISSGINDEAMQEFITDSNTRATAEYNRRRSTSGTYRTYLGNTITNINNAQASINGIPVSSDVAIKKIEQDKLIDDVVNGIKYGQIPINSQEDLNAAIIQGVQGIINSTGVTSQEEAVKIAHIIQNKVK